MKHATVFFLLILGATLLARPVLADGAGDVDIEGAYVRAVPPAQSNSAAFLSLVNKGAQPHVLLAARSDVADAVELHTHIRDGGVMRMRRIKEIQVPAGGKVSLEPGGLHIMLLGLQQPLKAGESITMEFLFEDGSMEKIDVPVRSIESTMQHHHHQ